MSDIIREIVFPRYIVQTTGCIENTEVLLKETDMQIGLDEVHLITVRGKSSIILDFGKELNGSVRILTHEVEGGICKVRIRTGESLSECCAEINEKHAHNHHTLRDINTEVMSYSDMTFLETGFRYVRIDFLEEKSFTLKAITAVYVHRDLKPIGGFVCDDERVNKIFDTAKHTLMLNMQEYIWDGIKRDRLVWIGDLHPEALGVFSLFRNDSSVEKALTFSKNQTPLPLFMNRTHSYTMWWLIILYDYYWQSGNLEYVLAQKDYIEGAVALIYSIFDESGAINVDTLFDWPSHNSKDEKAGLHAIGMLFVQKARKLLELTGSDTIVCDSLQAKLARKVYTVEEFKQCEAFLVYAGIKNAKASKDFLCRNGARGFSTFMSYYILSAISDGAGAETAVTLMKEYYGGMLDMGATSFWEDFDLDWMKGSSPIDRFPKKGEKDIHGDFGKHCYQGFRHSLCHGWASGPVPFLIRKLSGFEALSAGCSTVSINPQSAGLKWYELTVPTPRGELKVVNKDGQFTVRVDGDIEVRNQNSDKVRILL